MKNTDIVKTEIRADFIEYEDSYKRINNYLSSKFGKNQLESLIKENGQNINKKDEDHKNYFYKLTEINHDSDFPHRESIENILSSINDSKFNLVYLIIGENDDVSIYFGIVENDNTKEPVLNAYDYSVILKSSVTGNFQGSKLEDVEDSKDILNKLKDFKKIGFVSGIPSITEQNQNDKVDFQGTDRLVNGMLDCDKWGLLIINEPIDTVQIDDLMEKVYDVYNVLHSESLKSYNFQKSTNLSNQQSKGKGKTDTVGESESKSTGTSSSYADEDSSRSRTSSKSKSKNTSHAVNTNEQISEGKSVGTSESLTIEKINKKYQEYLKYIDEELLPRLNYGKSKGLFKTAVYTLANDNATNIRLQRLLVSVFQGNKPTFNPLTVHPLITCDKEKNLNVLLNKLNIYDYPCNEDSRYSVIKSQPVGTSKNGQLSMSTFMTTKELSFLVGVPMQEVPGMSLKKAVNFGLNVNGNNDDDSIELGQIIYRGALLEKRKIYLDRNHLSKHVFIAGVTDSGKTTTCMKLLKEAKIPYMVIEPAKTEYRKLCANDDANIKIFTLGNEQLAPFRFNPFELLQGESLSTHIDMLKATFTAAFPMEAAMPQIIEESVYRVYEMFGWDFVTSRNKYGDNELFPTFSDFIKVLEIVIKDQKFGAELASNYRGALISRLNNFTIGVKGKMLNCRKSVNFEKLLESNVIIEMDDLKDEVDKAMMMGFILSRLSEVLKRKHKKDPSFKHITLVEEAHRLLSKPEPGDGGSKKRGVNMFADLLAEVRKYGESLIIVDQIPNKLTPEVLKNTNTKIIHKLFAKDDKDSVGDTMGMNDEQKNFLSNLGTGEAIMFSQDWYKPVWVKITQGVSTNSLDGSIEDEKIKHSGDKNISNELETFYPFDFDVKKYKLEDLKIIDEGIKKVCNLKLHKGFDKNKAFFDDIKQRYSEISKILTDKKELNNILSKEFFRNSLVLYNEYSEQEVTNFFKSILTSILDNKSDEYEKLTTNQTHMFAKIKI